MEKKSIWAAVIGTMLEYYDVMLYGFFAVIIAPLFFPSYDPVVTRLVSMMTFAAGFVIRPLGGVFFGHLGDRYGRRFALSLSVLMVAIPTCVIGLLPTYEAIGLWAPVILIICRLLQGFCVGGESTGALTFIMEHAQPHQRGFASGIMIAACYGGGLLGTFVGSIALQSFMPDWGWRIPFLLGSFVGLVGFYLRRNAHETQSFLDVQQQAKTRKFPILDVLQHHGGNILRAAGVSAGAVVPFYLVSVYGNEILASQLHLSPSHIMIWDTSLMVFWTVMHIVFGWLSDRMGIVRMMQLSAVGFALAAYPAFWLIQDTTQVWNVLAMQLVLSVFGIAFSAPCCAALTALFPTNQRYSGVALGHSLGSAILGGMTPLIAVAISNLFQDPKAPAYYLMAIGVLAWIVTTYRGKEFLAMNDQTIKKVA